MTTRKVRFKKLSSKTQLTVLRENQIDPNEYESLTSETQINTGVEQAEENEFHLQSILNTSSGVSSGQEIPVPPPEESDIKYEELYHRKLPQTTSYIRFSQTVEECVGCPYDMTTEDDEFLTAYNKGKPAASKLTEDDFERLMDSFEGTATYQAPYAAVDKTVVPYDAMIAGLRELEDESLMVHAKPIYEHWKNCRKVSENEPVHPALKFETHQETDDMDPYVCFRRREVRQTRKTRNRDLQSGDKLKRLRKELEDARQLLLTVRDLELKKRDALYIDSEIFQRRTKLKQTKIRLSIRANDEDLINQKPQKRKAAEPPQAARPPPVPQLRIPVRPDTRNSEPDMMLLSDKLADKENELRVEIQNKVQHHQTWNKNHVDLTKGPLSPVRTNGMGGGFRQVKTQFPLTPPASDADSGDQNMGGQHDDKDGGGLGGGPVSYEDESLPSPQPEFRMRVGRLGRMWIDRRGAPSGENRAVHNSSSDRWKYDSDSEEELDMIVMDPNDTRALKFRATIPLPPNHIMARRQVVHPQPAPTTTTLPPGVGGQAGARPAVQQQQQQQQQPSHLQPQGQSQSQGAG